MKGPKIFERPVFLVTAILGGGPTEDGRNVVIEFKMRAGETAAMQFATDVAERLILAAQRFVFEAEKLRGPVQSVGFAPSGGALSITSAMIRFQLKPDGSGARLVVTGVGGPPVSIELGADDLPNLRKQIENTERQQAAAQKPQ